MQDKSLNLFSAKLDSKSSHSGALTREIIGFISRRRLEMVQSLEIRSVEEIDIKKEIEEVRGVLQAPKIAREANGGMKDAKFTV
jgi:hypothetical protein